MGRYASGFGSKEDIAKQFEIPLTDLDGAEILYANYDGGGYDGSAFVLLARDGKLFEVHGSHCSCNGLEDQWSEEETSVKALKLRLQPDGRVPYYVDKGEFEQLVNALEFLYPEE